MLGSEITKFDYIETLGCSQDMNGEVCEIFRDVNEHVETPLTLSKYYYT